MPDTREINPWVADRRESIGFAVQLIAKGDDPPGPALVEGAKTAEQLKLDGVFLGDHPSWAPEAYTHLTAIAMATETVTLGPMVASSPYRNPILTARLVSDIDHLSGGRFVNGLGIGWDASDWGLGSNEFERMGIPYPPVKERQEAMEEAITIIRGVWGDEPFSFAGTHYHIEDANVPAPAQQPEPPLVIAGGGKRTLGQVARLADMSNFGPGPAGGTDDIDFAKKRLDNLAGICLEIGRDYNDILRSHFVHWILLAKDESSLQQKIDRYFPGGPTGIWETWLVALTVDQAIEYFQRFVDIGMQYFVLQIQDPSGDPETMELLANEVATAFNS